MDYYVNDFENAMLDEIAAYYSQRASVWIVEDSCPHYMLKVDECLKNEKVRVSSYMHPSSETKLLETYHAKISDFGLAKLGPTTSKSDVSTQVMGTYGYAAPEYVATGHLYVKSDVYGFGVVLVEMLIGLQALDTSRPYGQHNLVEWIKPHLPDKRKLKNVMVLHLEGKYPSRSALHVAQLTLNLSGK